MKNPIHNAPDHGRLGALGHTMSEHTAEAGHKIRDEFDDVAPKVAAAASQAVQTAAHAANAAMERSRPIRTEAASRGSAALSGLLGEVSPAQIDRMSRRAPRRGRIALLLAAAGGVVIWVLWWKRSDPDLDPWQEEPAKPDTETAEDLAGP